MIKQEVGCPLRQKPKQWKIVKNAEFVLYGWLQYVWPLHYYVMSGHAVKATTILQL